MPEISVIMPSYNHQKYISEAIDSVLKQSFKDIELIIIQDGYLENMIKIIEHYARLDRRIVLKISNERIGVAKAFNLGLDTASGKYVAFIGSDDVWLENKLEVQLQYLRNYPGTIVWSDALIIDGESKELGYKFSDLYQAEKRSGYIFNELCFGNFISGQSQIFERNLLNGMRFDDTILILNDYKFNLDLSFKYKFVFINLVLVKYRMHRTNLTNLGGKTWSTDSTKMIKYILSTYENYISKEVKFYLLLRLSGSQFILKNFRSSFSNALNSLKFIGFKSLQLLVKRLKMHYNHINP